VWFKDSLIFYYLKPVKQNIEIFETAFVTADFRATDVALSKDRYAHLWPSEGTKIYRKAYVDSVSRHEPFAHCLRNRYFLEAIENLFNEQKIELLINFGCGFSMYPFLLPKTMAHIEIDMPHSINYKKEKIADWCASKKLPKRNISFLEADFTSNYEPQLLEKIASIKGNKRSFILLEGVLFFIGRPETERLFKLFSTIQGTDEYVGSVSFQKEIESRTAFKKLIQFTEERLVANEKFCYQTVEDRYYLNLDDYAMVDHQNTFTVANKYVPATILDPDEVLDEHFYVLKKK
tara:strand:- start:31695 stop:32567 length:873 start_codon:yes stop_codon:yes gene_type:complete